MRRHSLLIFVAGAAWWAAGPVGPAHAQTPAAKPAPASAAPAASLVELLRQIHYRDQQYRRVAAEADRKFGPGSPQAKEADRRQDPVDRQLIRQVDSLIARHGYPGRSLVGEEQQTTAFLVIQHNFSEKYLPLLTAAAEHGELPWSSLALLTDRLQTERGEPQGYGSQTFIGNSGKPQLYPIADEANVNARRAKIGLGPLEAYLRQFGITYRVPTATHNPNPPELYVAPRPASGEETSPYALIGGDEALHARLNYPEAARKQQVRGSVTVQLTIDKAGIPQNVEVVRGLGAGCDEEALRVMRAARFTNADGQEHEVRYSLPFPYSPPPAARRRK